MAGPENPLRQDRRLVRARRRVAMAERLLTDKVAAIEHMDRRGHARRAQEAREALAPLQADLDAAHDELRAELQAQGLEP